MLNHFHVLVYIGRPARLDDAGYRQPRVFHEGLFPSADGERIDRPQRSGASEFAAAKVYPGRRGAGSDQKGGSVMNGVCCGNLLWQSSLTLPDSIAEAQRHIDKHLVLIDGPKLLKYMIEYGLGVQTIAIHAIKKVDAEFFRDEF